MKALFFLLCLLNVLVFFWELHFGALTKSVEPPSNVPKLILLSERQTARRGAQISAYLDNSAAELQAKQVTDILQRLNRPPAVSNFKARSQTASSIGAGRQRAVTNNCYEAGPFNDQNAAQRWANAEHLSVFKPVYKSIILATDFQIYYPAAKDAEQSRINKLMLKAKGFADVWPITDGEVKGAISLGVFNERPRAMLYKNQLAEQGVKAEIRQRNKTREELFIRFTATPGATKKAATRLSAGDCGNVLK